MTCERFAQGTSILHRADPRVKIILALAVSIAIIALKAYTAQLTALAGAVILVRIAALAPKDTLKRLSAVNLFILLLWMVIPFTTPGEYLWSLGPLHISQQGIEQALAITIKCNAIVLFNLAFLSTSTVFSLAHALAHLRVPSKLVQLFFFSWRYLHLLEEELEQLKRAAVLRGFSPGANMHTYRTYANLLGTLFVRSYDRGQRIYNAMLCRGFDGTFWLLTHFKIAKKDILILSLGLLFCIVLILMDRTSPWNLYV